MKKFVKGRLYHDATSETILEFVEMSPDTRGPRFRPLTRTPLMCWDGLAGFRKNGRAYTFRRAFHWSDLPTAADKKAAALKCDPINGKFEEDFLRHYAAKRARLRNLTPVLGGEYYAKP